MRKPAYCPSSSPAISGLEPIDAGPRRFDSSRVLTLLIRGKTTVILKAWSSSPLRLSEPLPDRIDFLAGEVCDTEAKVGVSLSTSPRLDTECLDLVYLIIGENGADRPGSEHTPPFSHGVVDMVDLETDRLFGGDCADLSIIRRNGR